MFMHDDTYVTVFKALADKTRLDLVRIIASKPEGCASCSEVSRSSSLSQPALSHHYKKLVDAGVLLERKEGTAKTYEINRPLFDQLGINPNKI